MDKVTINIISKKHHCRQVIAGFQMLEKGGKLKLSFEDHSNDPRYLFKEMAILEVVGGGGRL